MNYYTYNKRLYTMIFVIKLNQKNKKKYSLINFIDDLNARCIGIYDSESNFK